MLNSDYAIKSYVGICNKALSLNKDRFPFKQILGAAKASEAGKKIEVQLAGDNKIDSYVFSFEGDKIVASSHSDCGHCNCIRKWHIEWPYLTDVLKNPDAYIENPAMLNWNWIYDKIS